MQHLRIRLIRVLIPQKMPSSSMGLLTKVRLQSEEGRAKCVKCADFFCREPQNRPSEQEDTRRTAKEHADAVEIWRVLGL